MTTGNSGNYILAILKVKNGSLKTLTMQYNLGKKPKLVSINKTNL